MMHPVCMCLRDSKVTVVSLLVSSLLYGFSFRSNFKKEKYHFYHFPRTACRFCAASQRPKRLGSITAVQLPNRFRQIRAGLA